VKESSGNVGQHDCSTSLANVNFQISNSGYSSPSDLNLVVVVEGGFDRNVIGKVLEEFFSNLSVRPSHLILSAGCKDCVNKVLMFIENNEAPDCLLGVVDLDLDNFVVTKKGDPRVARSTIIKTDFMDLESTIFYHEMGLNILRNLLPSLCISDKAMGVESLRDLLTTGLSWIGSFRLADKILSQESTSWMSYRFKDLNFFEFVSTVNLTFIYKKFEASLAKTNSSKGNFATLRSKAQKQQLDAAKDSSLQNLVQGHDLFNWLTVGLVGNGADDIALNREKRKLRRSFEEAISIEYFRESSMGSQILDVCSTLLNPRNPNC
jgi:hypothetical protein